MQSMQRISQFAVGIFAAAVSLAAGSAALPSAATEKELVRGVLEIPTALVAEVLPRAMNGEAAFWALSELNQKLVAQRAGLSVAGLLAALRQDDSLWVDRRGHLFYVEPKTEFAPSTDVTLSGADAGPLPTTLANTFKLHSKKQSATGRSRVIYLDFNGYNLPAGTGWAGGAAFDGSTQGYDTDGNPATFSDAERAWIQRVWQGVAETFAPFDVDVTTEVPAPSDITRDSATDDRYGTVAAFVNPEGNPVAANTQGRSIAYVGNFDAYDANTNANPEPHGYFQPAWVFVSRPNASTGFEGSHFEGVAATASHELGHNLGLSHDGDTAQSYYFGHGTGATSWAPIMGGAYKSVNQWSKGEYPGYQNPQTNPDDYQVMADNGLLARADSVGNTRTAAAPLTAALNGGGVYQVAQQGIIETPGDVDYFSFTAGAGNVTLKLDPAPLRPMMDVVASLYSSSGQLLAESNDPDGTSASISVTVPKGQYFLAIDGVGDINPLPGYSDYGSIGQYRISGTFTDAENAPPVAMASADKTSGNAPLTVKFSSAGSVDPEGSALTSYVWNFGDGSATVNNVGPTKVFANKGTYTVTLTVKDGSGLSATKSLPITVYGPGGPDTTPDAFSFSQVGNTDFNVVFPSNVVTPTGYDAPATVTISSGTGGEYSVNGAAFKSSPGTIAPGQTLQVRHRTSPNGSTLTETTIAVGGVAVKYRNQTAVADLTPDAFTFTDVTGVRFNDQMQSNSVTIKGMNNVAPISVTGGEYRIGDGPWTSAAGTITRDVQQVRVRHTSAGAGNSAVNTTLKVGTVSDTFTSTTASANLGTLTDSQPDQFTLVDQNGVAKSTVITSAGIKPVGYVLSAPVSIIGGEYRVTQTGQWKSTAGTVMVGQQIFVRHTSAATANAKVNTVLTVGGVSDTFTSTTAP